MPKEGVKSETSPSDRKRKAAAYPTTDDSDEDGKSSDIRELEVILYLD